MDLTPFCHETMQDLLLPIQSGNEIFATDGHLLVKIPSHKLTPECDCDYRPKKSLVENFIRVISEAKRGAWGQHTRHGIPEVGPNTCQYCDGKGKVASQPPNGELWADCLECNNGLRENIRTVGVGGVFFDGKYLNMITTTFGKEVAFYISGEEGENAYFCIGEGEIEGVLAPVRGP